MLYLILKLSWEEVGMGDWIRRLKFSVYVNIYRISDSFTTISAVQS
jgi:hypothetical protein